MTSLDKARQGLALLKEAILKLLAENRQGLRNHEIAVKLDICSDYRGSGKDYLSWSILGLLLNEDKIVRKGNRYLLPEHAESESAS